MTIQQIYERFRQYYKFNEGINIYPQFYSDLEKLLEYLGERIDNE